jgi:hypothetical protein
MKPGGISKEELIMRVKTSGCKMLKGLKLEEMRRSEIIEHLKKSCCPELRKLISLHQV